MESEPKSILLIKAMAIGDVLFTTPSIASLRNHFPKARIDMLVGQWSKVAVVGNPDLDEIITYDDSIFLAPKPVKILKLALQLRKHEYDWIISFHRSFGMALFSFVIGAPLRIGLEWRGTGFLMTHVVYSDPRIARYPVDIYLDIIRALNVKPITSKIGFFVSEEDRSFADQFLRENSIHNGDLVVAVCAGGALNVRETVSARRWPVESFASLIDVLVSSHGAKPILLGAKSDEQITSEVQDLMAFKPISAVGGTTLKQFASILERCDLLITNDSAPLHIAIAMNTPTVSLFGPTNALARVPNDSRHIAIQSSCECSPCYANEKKFGECKYGIPKCMADISVQSVLSAVEIQLSRKRNDDKKSITVS